ncbi:MAG TPA: hypothetical protein H9786_13755 [Candidatus Brachybacterium merdavium]|uniref:GRAM domain-containing protein n=1 Tax=Candidatus Brachybacterium merdavium TaxID=2838513 RepID=A0A9D2LFV9_9MICO|nr:hypothetical protein [Candidatus Brachybacterium merdavium]
MTSLEQHLAPGEQVLHQGRANMQRGLETVGGQLVLTEQRLLFLPHALNLQSHVSEIPLDRVSGVRKAWTKFLGAIPLAPNSLEIAAADGHSYSFVVTGRARWITAIVQARGGSAGAGHR